VLGLGVLTLGRIGAGTGCRYLTEQTLGGRDDFAELSPARALSYYSETQAQGESPGRWLGRGLPTLGLSGVVDAAELENVVGHGRHPRFDELLTVEARRLLADRTLTDAQRKTALREAERGLHLGRGYAIYESAASRAERAVADLGQDADEASRDAVRAEVLAEGDRQAVAGFELTFTPVKSVSVLAAIGGQDVWAQVMDAHRAAVDTALEYVQGHAGYSRAGVNGIRQIDTRGLVIAAFEHRMSRAGDPNIHTHAVVANRVQCVDGRWRTVDGRAVYAASVGARAVYEQALEAELNGRLGVRFSLDERRSIREVHGVPLEVVRLFSKRRAAIEHALGEAVEQRLPDGAWRRIARRFTLSTRDPKAGAESTAAAISRWRSELSAAGHDPDRLFATLTHPSEPRSELRPYRARSDAQIVADAGALLTASRAVWTRHHAVLAVSRVLPPEPDTDFADHQARVEALTEGLLAAAVQVTPPQVLEVGASLRRDSDLGSVFTVHADLRYAAPSTVAAEQRFLAVLADRLDNAAAPRIEAGALERHLARVPLGDDQHAAAHRLLTTPARVSALVGPAGSGKTYLQRAIATAWTAELGPVLALAPSQIAAHTLGDAIGARAENVPKWLHEHRRVAAGKRPDPDGEWTLAAGQLVILDEAGMVATRDLDAVLTAVRRAGARLLLVGDDKQLGAVGAGGMFATIAERTNAPVLSTVRRFRDEHGALREWECAASLGLRERELAAVAEYERRGRIHAGPARRMQDTIYRAWLADHLRFEAAGGGGVALLLADTEQAAAALSARARTDLVDRGIVEPAGTALADGTVAGVGDLIVTRLNERRLRATAPDGDAGFVANRDTWRVTERDADGALGVVSVTGTPRSMILPAGYVAANVQLAYAGTVHCAQGRTVSTARALVTESTTARALYVAMTRGTASNEIYLVTDDPDREPHQRLPAGHHLAVLARILGRDTHQTRGGASVTDTARDLSEQATSTARLRLIFGDLSTVVRGADYRRIITTAAGEPAAHRALTDPAWATLVGHLGNAQAVGWDARELLRLALTQRSLAGAGDVAAVLHWRCAAITNQWQPPAGDMLAPAVGRSSWTSRADAIIAGTHDAGSHSDGSLVDAPHVDAPHVDAPHVDAPHVDAPHIDAAVTADAAAALREVAAVLDRRAEHLALRLADQAAAGAAPAWLAGLGTVPTDPGRRRDWLERARAVAVYHDATGYQPTSADPLGPRPPAGDMEARELWDAARAALADAPLAATLRAMLPERLRGWVAQGLHAETVDQPPYIGHELRAVSLRERAHRTRLTRLRHELADAEGRLTALARRPWLHRRTSLHDLRRVRDHAAARVASAEHTHAGITRDLQRATGMHQDWQAWEQATRDIRTRARLCTQELALRHNLDAPAQPDRADRAVPTTPVADTLDAAARAEQYAIHAAAAAFYTAHLHDRWAPAYLHSRRLTDPARAAGAGYAPSRPGQWTLLTDHLRALGHSDTAIATSGLASRSRRGDLIDRFRDRLILPILDTQDRPIGFLGRKPAGDTDPRNPKYLNPPRTPLYDKSRVLIGLDSDAIARLHAGARPVLVEGAADRLAILAAGDHLRAAGQDLVPLAPSGVALTAAHLDLLAHHTDLARVLLAFDPDRPGQAAARTTARMIHHRGTPATAIEIYTGPPGADPADILKTHGPGTLARLLADPAHRATLLDHIVDEQLDPARWAIGAHPLRDLPIRTTAARAAVAAVAAELARIDLDPAMVAAAAQRQTARIADHTGVELGEINAMLIDRLIPDDPAPDPNHPDSPRESGTGDHWPPFDIENLEATQHEYPERDR
jgi:DNA primase catalytic core